MKRLALNKETLRTLSQPQMTAVIGGWTGGLAECIAQTIVLIIEHGWSLGGGCDTIRGCQDTGSSGCESNAVTCTVTTGA